MNAKELRAKNSRDLNQDLLKARRYAWNAPAKVWQRVVAKKDLESEHTWLAENIYRGKSRATVSELSIHSRFRRGEEQDA